MTVLVTSTATVALDRADRYAKQLVNHLSRRTGGAWSPEAGRGWIDLEGHHARVAAEDGVIGLSMEAPEEYLDRFELVLGSHLIRFTADSVPEVSWVRSDGSKGTFQRPSD